MIIDIHSHILPGIDDGARNMDEAIEMLKMAIQEGINEMVVTPHYEVGVEQSAKYQEAYDALEEEVRSLKRELGNVKIDAARQNLEMASLRLQKH